MKCGPESNLNRRQRQECEAGHPEESRSGEFEERKKGWKRLLELEQTEQTRGLGAARLGAIDAIRKLGCSTVKLPYNARSAEVAGLLTARFLP
jgi:hypothetical protein